MMFYVYMACRLVVIFLKKWKYFRNTIELRYCLFAKVQLIKKVFVQTFGILYVDFKRFGSVSASASNMDIKLFECYTIYLYNTRS